MRGGCVFALAGWPAGCVASAALQACKRQEQKHAQEVQSAIRRGMAELTG